MGKEDEKKTRFEDEPPSFDGFEKKEVVTRSSLGKVRKKIARTRR